MFSGLEGLVCRSSCGSQTVRVGPAEALACPPTVRAEPVAAWALLLRPFGLSLSKPWRAGWKSMLGFRAGAGLSPRQATHFSLLRQRKVSKRKATPSLRPLRGAKGQTCVGTVAGCAAELTSLLCSSVRTTAASQSTKHGRFDAHATPQPPRRRRSQQGWGSQTATRAIAALGLAFAARGACAREGGAERSDGPCGLPGFPSGCAEERSGQRIRARDCLSAVKRSEFERDPAGREHRRLPAAKRRDAACRVAFSLVTFFWRSKRKLLRRRAHTPASALKRGHTVQISERAQALRLRQAQPDRVGATPRRPQAQTERPSSASNYQKNSCQRLLNKR